MISKRKARQLQQAAIVHDRRVLIQVLSAALLGAELTDEQAARFDEIWHLEIAARQPGRAKVSS